MPGFDKIPGRIGPDLVGPGGKFGQGVWACQVPDGFLGLIGEVALGDLRRDAVPGRTPGSGKCAAGDQKAEGKEDFFHGSGLRLDEPDVVLPTTGAR